MPAASVISRCRSCGSSHRRRSLGCIFLFFNLPAQAMLFLPIWGAIGLVIYFVYSRARSHLGRGIVEVVDDIGGE